MPKKNGLDTLREIRSDPHLRGIKVVLMTASPTEEVLMRGLATGADRVLAKAPSFRAIEKIVRDLMSTR